MIHAVLNGDLSHALETLIAVSVLILVVLMVRRPVSRQFGAGVVYMLWAIPVVRFFLPPLSTPVSFLNVDLGGLLPAEEVTTTTFTNTDAATFTFNGPAAAEAPMTALPGTLSDPALIASTSWTDDLLAIGLMTVVAAWLAGTVYLIARSLLAHRTFMQTVEREAMPVSAPMADLVARIAAETGLRRPPRLVASLISRGPFVTGLFRPVVVMPAWFEDDYTPMEARAALAHELMHVRRGDLWALQVSELFVAAMWFNPLAYIARNAFRTDQEAACDADVLARCQTSPHAYGSTLVKAARLHLPEPAMAAGRLPLTHALKERLTRMTYPAPTAKRRMIGFGAALLFGASTLAITASVASAGEPESTETHEFRIETDTHWISDGDDDRQIVLLGDPMAKVMPIPPVPPEVGELQRRIEIDVAELTGPDMLGPIISWHESEDWEEFADLAEEMAELHGDMVEEVVTEEDGKRIVKRIHRSGGDLTDEQRAALEVKLESKAAMLEARMAARESEMEAHEARIDQQVIMIEKRIDMNAEEIERIMEERFGEDFEARIEAQAEVIEYLVDSCEDAELATGETRIIERADADGEMFRLACIEGNRETLEAPATLAAIEAYPGLTADEIASFKKAAKGHKGKRVFVYSTDISEMPEPPEPVEPPEAPEAPLKGE